jgi:hypothetical protein
MVPFDQTSAKEDDCHPSHPEGGFARPTHRAAWPAAFDDGVYMRLTEVEAARLLAERAARKRRLTEKTTT